MLDHSESVLQRSNIATLCAQAPLFESFDNKIKENSDLNSLGTAQCESFRDSIFVKARDLAGAFRAEYDYIAKTSSYVHANRRLLELEKRLESNGFNITSSDDDIFDLSNKLARISTTYINVNGPYKALSLCLELASEYSLDFSSLVSKVDEIQPLLNRFKDPAIWKRKIGSLCRSEIQALSRELRQTHKFFSPYSSRVSIKRHQNRMANTLETLSRTKLENELGQSFSLADIASRNPSNPYIRFVEFVTVAKGYASIASQIGYQCLFVTLTAPSCMHRMQLRYKHNGKKKQAISAVPNPNWDGSTPKQVNQHLAHLYELITAKLARKSIHKFGFRVVEPHHDGTPHWHLALLIDPQNIDAVKEVFTEYALRDYPNEKGAQKNRIDFKVLQSEAAIGYLVKYISKSTTGIGLNNAQNAGHGEDWYGTDAIKSALSIEAWARDCGIRQFQIIGVHSVQAYREFRRLDEQQDPQLEAIRQAARNGDWAEFVNLMGGPFISRKDMETKLAYGARQRLNRETGEIETVSTSKYGDEAKDTVIGVIHAGITILSRIHFWDVKVTPRLTEASQKIMDGVVDLLDEIHFQNTRPKHDEQHIGPHFDENLFSEGWGHARAAKSALQQTKSVALDSFQ